MFAIVNMIKEFFTKRRALFFKNKERITHVERTTDDIQYLLCRISSAVLKGKIDGCQIKDSP